MNYALEPLTASNHLLATAEAENAPIVLAGVLLSLVVIYLASKLGGELSRMLDFPPVLGELVGGAEAPTTTPPTNSPKTGG
ncbi:MAG: hypothetical protein AAFX46_18165, partial [Cyanobacteria bacterium J06636_27]